MQNRSWQRSVFAVFGICLMPAVFVPDVSAQSPDSRRWEIEFHGGGLLSTAPGGGTANFPTPGKTFVTSVAARSSRPVSSWYFGDGSLLFNEVASQLDAVIAGGFSPRITALDPILGRSLGAWPRSGSLGVRVGRRATSRVSVDVSVDYMVAGARVTQANSDAIEATKSSFTPAFNRLLTFTGTLTPLSITSTSALAGERHQLAT